MITRIARLGGIPRHISPHSLRHAAITKDAGVPLRDAQILAQHAHPRTIEHYDRDRLLADPNGAELVVSHHLQGETRKKAFLPRLSLRPIPGALIADAPIDSKTGVDAKLVVRAKRRYDAMVEGFFKTTPGFRTGCTVAVSSNTPSAKPGWRTRWTSRPC